MDKRQFFKTGLLGIGALVLSNKLKALEYYRPKTDNSFLPEPCC
jgi:hypothetical protein